MDDFLNRISGYSPKRLALLADELQRRVTQLERAAHAPIAIVGMACRFPGGADTPEKLWQLLERGADAIREVPPERFRIDDYFDENPDAPGKLSSRWGGFLEQIERFDAHFFGISPREAQRMDPQQRLLLEVAWEALESAGVNADRLAETSTGVFVGMSSVDYLQLMRSAGLSSFDAYTASGAAHSIASGRLSYLLGARGPSMTIDTACSSSLVAIHQAVSSLRRGESSLALAGGVNLILRPDVTVALSKAHMMAPDGRCKVFDARADGFVRSEGCGVLVLKRLSDAQADGDPIVAVIRGSASNQDGRSNGLTAPSGAAQEAVVRAALADAGLQPRDVDFVEAHGTGTSLGDPIEVQALAAVFSAERSPERPLLVGSLKANLGHMEAAAGVASVIKLALALRHGVVPGQPHFVEPNPFIPWSELPVQVPRAATPWPGAEPSARHGGASSFGFSGTNVHVVLSAPPAASPRTSAFERPRHLLALSARTDAARRALLERARQTLSGQDAPDLADVAYTANTGRAAFAHRAAIAASTQPEAIQQLDELLSGATPAGAQLGVVPPRPPRIAFLFSGQGAQHAGMARSLYATQPRFRELIDECEALLRPRLAQPLLSVLHPAPGASSPLHETAYTQPALFAVEYALAKLWQSWGVEPTAVLGHSLGELVAACVAGVLSLTDALLLVAERGRLMSDLPERGSMAALMTNEAEARALIAAWPGEVTLAALNGPENVVISGRDAAITAILERAATAGIGSTRLTVSHAFHSPLIEPMLAELERVAAGVEHRRATLDLISNLSGDAQTSFDARYWRSHARSPVQFARSMQTLARLGYDAFVEIGPHPTLLGMARQCLNDDSLLWIPSLRRGREDWEQLLESLAKLYVRGVSVDWERFDAGYARRKVQLPSYPFQRERFWVDVAAERPDAERSLATAAAAPPSTDSLASITHEIVWRDGPIVGGALPAPRATAALVAPRIAAIAAESGLPAYAPFGPALDQLAAQYILQALKQLGAVLPPGARFTAPRLAEQLGVLPRHARLFERLLRILAEDGWLSESAGELQVLRALDGEDPDALAERLLARYPNGEAELTLTRRCARELGRVLRGQADPLALLFPGGSLADMERLYRTSAPATAYNRLLGEAVAVFERSWSDERPLRILEIGGGTGSTTAYVLPALRDDRTSYTFTDLSPLFLNRARETFAERACLHFAVLDISSDPLAQGFEPASFDLIIGANVVHATPDVGVSVRNALRLLAPGGQLLLLEGTSPQRFGDLTVGLLEGWWAYTDVSRRSYALMSRESWLAVLREAGYADAAVIVEQDAGPVLEQQAIFVAQAPAAPRTPSGARWLITPDSCEAAQALASQLCDLGEDAVVLARGAEPLAAALADAARARQPLAGIVDVSALEVRLDDATSAEELWAAQQRLLGGALDSVRTATSAQLGAPPRLWFVTQGGQATRDGEAANPAQATLWGLSHVVALEHAELGCKRVDLDPASPLSAALRPLALELCTPSREDQLALRGDRRLLRRLVHQPPQTLARAVAIASDKTYLVTGGLRGLGLLVAEWLVQRGARSLLLMGRRAPDASIDAKLDQLRATGARVTIVTGDVAREADVQRALNAAQELPPLAGVIHAAGVLDDGVLSAQNWQRFATVMAPKVLGTWHLHRLTGQLDFFVLFSSGAAIAGSAGQANHAAANAFEDALAWYRQASGKPTVSINWGPWAEVGAAADRKVSGPSFVHPLSLQDGLRAFEAALAPGESSARLASTQVVVIATDWNELERAPSAWRASPLFRELAPARAPAPEAAPIQQIEPELSLREQLLGLAPNRRLGALQGRLRGITVKVLGAQHHGELDIHEPLRQLGLDSLMAVELRNLLAQAVGRPMPATITFDYPTVSALADYFATQVFGQELFPTAAASAAIEPPEPLPDDSTTADDLTSDELAARLALRLDRLFPDERQ